MIELAKFIFGVGVGAIIAAIFIAFMTVVFGR